jgi:hypothetical protein
MKLSEKLADQNSDVEFYNGTLADEARALEAEVEEWRAAFNEVASRAAPVWMADELLAARDKLARIEEALKHWDLHQAVWDAQQILKGEKP